MKVLVTGGAGFIGANLCRELVRSADVTEVRVVDNLSTGFRASLRGVDVSFIEGSILDSVTLHAAADGVDTIVHLAALGSVPRSIADPMATHMSNATGTLNVLNCARELGNTHVVLASSSSVYGANPVIPKVETLQTMPMSPYAVSKLAGEQYAVAFARCYDLPVLPLRFFNVFGPGQMPGHAYSAVIPVFVEAALQRRPLPVHGDGHQSRDFTFVGTVVQTLISAIRFRTTAGPTNLAFGTRTTINELIRVIAEVVDEDLTIDHRPERPGDVRHSQADNARLRELFPELKPTALDVGLRQTVEWMRAYLLEPYGTASAIGGFTSART